MHEININHINDKREKKMIIFSFKFLDVILQKILNLFGMERKIDNNRQILWTRLFEVYLIVSIFAGLYYLLILLFSAY